MLVYTGMAADILEIFEAFRENKVNIYTQCSMFMDIVTCFTVRSTKKQLSINLIFAKICSILLLIWQLWEWKN